MTAMPLVRSLRRLAPLSLLAALFALPSARAQSGNPSITVYATASPTYLNHLFTLSNTTPATTTLAGQWFYGFNGGVTFNVPSSGNGVSLGIDFRGGPEIGTPGLANALAGLKLKFPSPAYRLKPYTQLSFGWLEQRHRTGTGSSTYYDAESYFATELFAGVDYPVTRHLDIRLVEVGGGLTHVLVTNGTNTQFHPDILSLNSGLVYNF